MRSQPSLWLGNLPHLPTLQEVADVFPGPHCLLLSLTEKEDRVMSEILFVLRDDSFSKSFRPRILAFLDSSPPPLFFSLWEGFH